MEKKKQVKQTLDLYKQLKTLGYDYDKLQKIMKASGIFKDSNEVLIAINKYQNLAQMNDEAASLEDKRQKMTLELKDLEVKLVHTERVWHLCESLLFEYGLGVSAIEDLCRMAERIGTPSEVFKAFSQYQEIDALKKEIEKVQARKRGLEASIKELNGQIEELRSTLAELRRDLKQMITLASARMSEMASGVGDAITATIEKSLDKLITTFDSIAKMNMKMVGENSANQEKSVNALVDASGILGKAFETAIGKISDESIRTGRVLERIDSTENRIKTEILPLYNLLSKPTKIETPMNEVIRAGILFATALRAYFAANKGAVDHEYSLRQSLDFLIEEFSKRVKND